MCHWWTKKKFWGKLECVEIEFLILMDIRFEVIQYNEKVWLGKRSDSYLVFYNEKARSRKSFSLKQVVNHILI